MARELYTVLFVRSNGTLNALQEQTAVLLWGHVERSTVVAGELEADVRPNEYLKGAEFEDYDDFIRYPFTIEVVSSRLGLDAYLARLGGLMEALHSSGAAVVAACDWEDRLPGRGRLGVTQRTLGGAREGS